MASPVSSFYDGFTQGGLTLLTQIPGVGRLMNRQVTPLQNEEEGITRINEVALDQLSAPATGGVGCLRGLGCCGGVVAGVLLGTVIMVIATPEFWGTGAGLLVQGNLHNDQGLITAGKILLIYVTPPLIGIGACIGGIAGGFSGATAANS